MVIRSDIKRLAKKLSLQSHFDNEIIYIFLTKCGRALKVNPCCLDWCVSDERIYLNGHRESYCLFLRLINEYTGNYTQKTYVAGVDYELMILGDIDEGDIEY